VTEYLTNELLVQSIKGVDIVQKRTRLTKLVCRYIDTGLLVQDGKILPNLASVGSSEQLRRTLSQPPTRPESGMEVRPPSDTMFPDQQGLIPFYNAPQSQQPYRAVESHTNTAKRRKISGHATFQALEGLFRTQEDNQNISAPSSEASLTNTHGEHQALDVTTRTSVLQSFPHGSQGYMGDAAGIMPQLENRSQPSSPASVAIPGRYPTSKHSLARREASGAAVSDNESTISTNSTANHDALPGPSTTTTVDGLRSGITDNLTIEDSTGNFVQSINEHSSPEYSSLDRACESRLPSPTLAHTSTINHIDLDSGTGITPTPNIVGRIGEECGAGFESSAPIRLSDYIDPEMIEDIREWETVWAPEET
jgi:hypothetical protein